MTDFSMLGLAEPVLKAINAGNYSTPTPIQAKAIPLLLDGSDLIGIAQTGTGKTAAFLLPILDLLARHKKQHPVPGTCKALIVAPTRELASQIQQSVFKYGKFLRPSTALVVGGVNPHAQKIALRAGVDICIATPGRLMDHMNSGVVSLNKTMTVVLDEADQMFDLGFFPAIKKILGAAPKDRQTILFSATMPKPIRQLANEFLKNPKEISVAAQSTPVEKIDQQVRLVSGDDKKKVLFDILSDVAVTQAIVFTRTKRGADKVAMFLRKAGLDCVAIHGDRSQGQRDRALKDFRKGSCTIMVATDVAARGLDINGVSHVINYELPNVPEAYVHRIGRTARAGADGIAISLCDPSERGQLKDIEKLIGRPLISPQTPGYTPFQAMPKAKSGRGGRAQNSGDGRPSGPGGDRRKSSWSPKDGKPSGKRFGGARKADGQSAGKPVRKKFKNSRPKPKAQASA